MPLKAANTADGIKLTGAAVGMDIKTRQPQKDKKQFFSSVFPWFGRNLFLIS